MDTGDRLSFSSKVVMNIKYSNGCEKLMQSLKHSSQVFPFWNLPEGQQADLPIGCAFALLSRSLLLPRQQLLWAPLALAGEGGGDRGVSEGGAAANVSPQAEW